MIVQKLNKSKGHFQCKKIEWGACWVGGGKIRYNQSQIYIEHKGQRKQLCYFFYIIDLVIYFRLQSNEFELNFFERNL